MGRGRPALGTSKEPMMKTISKQDKKDLTTLAYDFGLLHREDVQNIIADCNSYAERKS